MATLDRDTSRRLRRTFGCLVLIMSVLLMLGVLLGWWLYTRAL
jgi:hypothetical protein